MKLWHTILELKKDHAPLGLKGELFFICDFPKNIATDTLDYVIAQPICNGLEVGRSTITWVVNKEQLEEFFNISDRTFKDIEKELMEDFHNDTKSIVEEDSQG